MVTTADHMLFRVPEAAVGCGPAQIARTAAGRVPPASYVVTAIVSAQLGSSLAKFLFATLGPFATVSLRTAFAALVLLAVWRPQLRVRPRADLLWSASRSE